MGDPQTNQIAAYLAEGARALGIPLRAEQEAQLLAYLALLQAWGQKMNLIGKGSDLNTVSTHLLDSIAAAPHLQGEYVLDVGSGAGLPGVPLSIIAPQKQFVLLEARLKRIVFLRQVKRQLGLDNVTLAHCRLEAYRNGHAFGTILSRAFAPLEKFASMVTFLAQPNTQLIAFVGKIHDVKWEQLSGWHREEIIPLRIPGIIGDRHLVRMRYHGEKNEWRKESHDR